MKRILPPAFCIALMMALIFGMWRSPARAEALAPYPNPTESEEVTMNRMIITAGKNELTVLLANNPSADALTTWLAEGPKTIPASNYGGFEKVCPLGVTLPSDDAQTTTQPGDVMLYSSSQLVIFHGSNAWAYTRIGWIEGLTQEALQTILSGPETEITLRLE